MKSIILFFCVFSTFFSLTALSNDREKYFIIFESSTSTSKVDVTAGSCIEEEVDLVVAGVEPLSLRRFYNHLEPSDERYGGWRFNPECQALANLDWTTQDCFVAIGEEDGRNQCFDLRFGNRYRFNPETQTHFMQYSPSGQTHPLNTEITFWTEGDAEDIHRFAWSGWIVDGSGRERFFKSPSHRWLVSLRVVNDKKPEKELILLTPDLWTPYQLPIYEERRPNGNIVCYSYERWKEDKYFPHPFLLKSIVAYNSSKTKVLGFLQFKYLKVDDALISQIEILGSDGRKVLINQSDLAPLVISSVSTPQNPRLSYFYRKHALTRVEKPDGKVLITEYEPTTNKVSAHYAPLGSRGELRPLAYYRYSPNTTEVEDTQGSKTRYYFDSGHRITTVENYQDEELYSISHNTWDKKSGNLLCKTNEDLMQSLYFKTEYIYDKNQNVIEEKITTNQESYSIFRTFSDDGFNLKLSEKDGTGKYTEYQYVPGTNLLSAEFLYDGSQITSRTFHYYDDCAAEIKTVIDDGASQDPEDLSTISMRKITEISPKQEFPCLGLPEVVKVKMVNPQGEAFFVSKTIYTYTPFGKVSRVDHYDEEGSLLFSTMNTYDDRERLVTTMTDEVQ